jgi:hypothetical protein
MSKVKRHSDSIPGRKGRPRVQVNVEAIEALFGIPQPLAAKTLGISLTALKQVCRKMGVARWPYQRGAQHAHAVEFKAVELKDESHAVRSPEEAQRDLKDEKPCCKPCCNLILVPGTLSRPHGDPSKQMLGRSFAVASTQALAGPVDASPAQHQRRAELSSSRWMMPCVASNPSEASIASTASYSSACAMSMSRTPSGNDDDDEKTAHCHQPALCCGPEEGTLEDSDDDDMDILSALGGEWVDYYAREATQGGGGFMYNIYC